MKIVWMIQNLVPYHHARFNAFSELEGVDGVLVQVTDKDPFSVLEFEAPSSAYELKTLFPGRARETIKPNEIREKFAEVMATVKPDCVCVSGWGMEIGWSSHHWALKNNVPVVMFSESTSYDEPRKFIKEWIKSRLVRSSSAALVGGTPHREYAIALGSDPSSIFLGHNVVDSSFFSEPATSRPDEVPAWMEAEPFFLICTRFGQKKNIPRVVKSYKRYKQLCVDAGLTSIKFAMAGDGEMREAIDAAVESEKLADEMILLGAMKYNTLPWMYQNCQAFVHASTTEQWGLVVNEAMAAGVPVIVSSRTGSAPDLVQEGQNGFQLDAYDEKDIARALFDFTKLSADEKQQMGNRSREIVKDWGPDRFAAGLKGAVDKAISSGPKSNVGLPVFLIEQLLKKGSE